MSTPSKGDFAFIQDLPEYQGLPENKNKNLELENNYDGTCNSEFKKIFDELLKMDMERTKNECNIL
jgi:hypothetical protein